MTNKDKDVKINSQRTGFSKRIKRKVLLEVAKGKKPEKVLLEYAFSSLDEVTKDKKYAAKLIHKWKKELYENKEILYLVNHKITPEVLEDEVRDIGDDDEIDDIEEEILDKFESDFLKKAIEPYLFDKIENSKYNT